MASFKEFKYEMTIRSYIYSVEFEISVQAKLRRFLTENSATEKPKGNSEDYNLPSPTDIHAACFTSKFISKRNSMYNAMNLQETGLLAQSTIFETKYREHTFNKCGSRLSMCRKKNHDTLQCVATMECVILRIV